HAWRTISDVRADLRKAAGGGDEVPMAAVSAGGPLQRVVAAAVTRARGGGAPDAATAGAADEVLIKTVVAEISALTGIADPERVAEVIERALGADTRVPIEDVAGGALSLEKAATSFTTYIHPPSGLSAVQ